MKPTAAILRRMFAASLATYCIVPDDDTVTEWAEKYRILPETSTAPGPYRVSVTPYARRPQDLTADPDVPLLVLCWASQTTKSTVIENALGRKIHRHPTPMMVLRPKVEDAEGWAKERFVPMVLDTPVLRERVRLGRSSGATLRYKPFPGGFVFIASAQSATEMASRSAPEGLADEVDRMEILKGEGNPLEIFKRRQAASDVGQLVVTSTPRDAETTIIWPYLEGGTFELYHVPCPHCGHMQPLVWSGLKWDKGKPETAMYVCGAADAADASERGCGALIDRRAKTKMLARGQWVPTNPEAPYPSFHLNALYSPFAKSDWPVLAEEWERAQGKPADLQVFVNTRLAELWTETAEVADPESLLKRLEPLNESIVPEGVGVLTVGGDAQQNRVEIYVWGWGAGLESWLVAYGLFPGDPHMELGQPGSPWDAAAKFLMSRFRMAAGDAVLGISAGLIDSGYATSQVYRFCKRFMGRNIFASKGMGNSEGNRLLGKPTPQGRERFILYPVSVDEGKREFLRSQIMEKAPGPGYVHLPDWMTVDQCEQLVSEKRVRRVHRGKVSYEWMKKSEHGKNEGLDCRIYARAALEMIGAQEIGRLGALAKQQTATAQRRTEAKRHPAPTPKPLPGARPPTGGNFATRWKRK